MWPPNDRSLFSGEVIHCYVTTYNGKWGALKKNPKQRDFDNNTLTELKGAPTAYELLANQSVISSRNYCKSEYSARQLKQWHDQYLSDLQG